MRPAGERYRDLLAAFPAGVTVVTAFTAAGEPRGLTLIAFCGVSLEPPLVLVCVDRASNTLPAIEESRGFTVNLISTGSAPLARLMATKARDKFAGVDWWRPEVAEAGPVLHRDATAHLLCRTWDTAPGGDHVIFIGEVAGGAVDPARPPLVFHRRDFAGVGRVLP